MPGRAVVVGAGIGGLSAALVLAQRGFSVKVVEQVAAFGEVGAGIQLSPNASRILLALGLGPQLEKIAFRPEWIEMRHWRTGRIVLRMKLGKTAERRFGAPYVNVHRADLHELMLDAIRMRPEVELQLGARCVGAEQVGGPPAALLEGGGRVEGDVVVGADGIKSAVQASLHGESKPRFTGCVAWRGIIPLERLRGVDVRPVATNWLGPGAHFVHYLVKGGAALNFVGVREMDSWTAESWTTRGEKADLIRDFAGWHETVQQVVAQADPERCYKWALFDRRPLPQWGRGHITLLGDASHPTLPFMAQGGCMAFEDAAVLGRCVAGGDIAGGLKAYENIRRPRTSMVQALSRRNKMLYHLQGVRATARNLSGPVLSMMLGKASRELFAYDALQPGDA